MPVPPDSPLPRPAAPLLAALREGAGPAATSADAREVLLRRQLLALFAPEPAGQRTPQKLS
ncbi:MAG TPA: hypothetical protein VFV15_03385 [Moraxellaceae bacterium]|nr:hypothetical protein [Moraxellaceae bacterium]